MKDGEPKQRQAWFDLERFRSARAFGQGGCVLAGLLIAALMARLLNRHSHR